MSNMSYCRFQNTSIDLQDCKEVLDNDELTNKDSDGDFLSREEFEAAIEIIEMAKEIAEMFEDEDLDELREQYKLNKNK